MTSLTSPRSTSNPSRAGDGARTRDIKLGRLALYQLSYSRTTLLLSSRTHPSNGSSTSQWWGKDSNLRRALTRQIYSLLPLATRPPHRTFARLENSHQLRSRRRVTFAHNNRADGQNRTGNRLITNQVLCQLSYVSGRPLLRETRRISRAGNRVKPRSLHSLANSVAPSTRATTP